MAGQHCRESHRVAHTAYLRSTLEVQSDSFDIIDVYERGMRLALDRIADAQDLGSAMARTITWRSGASDATISCTWTP